MEPARVAARLSEQTALALPKAGEPIEDEIARDFEALGEIEEEWEGGEGGGVHAGVEDRVLPRSRHERGEAVDEGVRRVRHVRGAIGQGAFSSRLTMLVA